MVFPGRYQLISRAIVCLGLDTVKSIALTSPTQEMEPSAYSCGSSAISPASGKSEGK